MCCRLSSDVEKELIKLLTVDLDMKRLRRVNGDDHCQMIKELQNGQRQIIVNEAKVTSFTNYGSGTNNINGQHFQSNQLPPNFNAQLQQQINQGLQGIPGFG